MKLSTYCQKLYICQLKFKQIPTFYVLLEIYGETKNIVYLKAHILITQQLSNIINVN